MNQHHVAEKFERIGARVHFDGDRPGLAVDVVSGRTGEYFEIRTGGRSLEDLLVLDVRPSERHLLLMARSRNGRGNPLKQKFLCGHDERHWFVAAVPENRPVTSVRTAREALKPRAALASERRSRLRRKERNRRRNRAWVRQGEWFFVPAPGMGASSLLVMYDEPIHRGNGGKPHLCEELLRTGGQTVYVSAGHPAGLGEADYRRIVSKNPGRAAAFRAMKRDPVTYVRGRVTHPDHATVVLPFWHRVVMNTENESLAMRSVAFLD